MERLGYETLEAQGYKGYLLKKAPEKVLQFGGGNFLRGFVDHFFDVSNERAGFDGKVVVARSVTRGGADSLNEQHGLYTLILRGAGQKTETRVISCVSRSVDMREDFGALLGCAENRDLRYIVSNTTEAGIVFDPSCRADDMPPSSFPGKLTLFLYRRYRLGLPGFIILPCELIDDNGGELLRCVEKYISLWELGEDFLFWVKEENIFCSTLVDRIVTGFPRSGLEMMWEELGYEDRLIDIGEPFGLWVIEGPEKLRDELPFERAGLPVIVTDDHRPYKRRKVRILNGAHTAIVAGAYLSGFNIVRDSVNDPVVGAFMKKAIYEEIIPNLTDLPKAELYDFASAVKERFANPYIDHALLSIALNTTSKWRARIMPGVIEYAEREGRLPMCLIFSFAAYAALYHGADERGDGCLLGRRGDDIYEIKDEACVLDFFYERRRMGANELMHDLVREKSMWGGELTLIPGFEKTAARMLSRIGEIGMYEAMGEIVK